MNASSPRWFAAMMIAFGVASAGAAETGCSAAPETEEDAQSAAEEALTVQSGENYIISIDAETITLSKSSAGVPLRFQASDFAQKKVLIHPLEGKTSSGVYAAVEQVEDLGNTLVLHTRQLQFEEMENTSGSDVIRLYRNRRLTVAPTSPTVAGIEDLGNFLQPAAIAPLPTMGGIKALSWGGPLAGDMTPDIWVGNKRAYAGGQITTSVESAKVSFKPSAVLDYVRGKGLSIGVRGQFTADLALKASGYAEGHVIFFDSPTLKSPRVTFVVPMGVAPFLVPVPVVLGVDAYVECTTMGAVEFDGVFNAHIGLNASASAVLRPSLRRPLKEWIGPGVWPNKVDAQVSFGKTPESKISGHAGIACAAPRIEFPLTVAGLIGPFLAIHPEFAFTTSGIHTTVDLYAGAASEIGNERFFELLLLRWEPGNGE